MFIDATSDPELQSYTPNTAGLPLPDMGIYPGKYQVASGEPGETQKKEPKFDITFEGVEGPLQGQRFTKSFLTGHSNPTVARIAIQQIMDIAQGITGINYANQKFNFDQSMYFKPFDATFVVEPQIDKNTKQVVLDDNGNPRKNTKFRGIKFIDNSQPQGGQYSQPPSQTAQYQQQPITQPGSSGTTPSWNR